MLLSLDEKVKNLGTETTRETPMLFRQAKSDMAKRSAHHPDELIIRKNPTADVIRDLHDSPSKLRAL
jgi:hypothetical protein